MVYFFDVLIMAKNNNNHKRRRGKIPVAATVGMLSGFIAAYLSKNEPTTTFEGRTVETGTQQSY